MLPSTRPRLPFWLSFCLALSVLWAPVWGQWHGWVHGSQAAFLANTNGPQGHTPAAGEAAEKAARAAHHTGHHSDHHTEQNAQHHANHHAEPHGHASEDPLGHAADSELCHVLQHLASADRIGAAALDWASQPRPAPEPAHMVVFAIGQLRWSFAQARAPPVWI